MAMGQDSDPGLWAPRPGPFHSPGLDCGQLWLPQKVQYAEPSGGGETGGGTQLWVSTVIYTSHLVLPPQAGSVWSVSPVGDGASPDRGQEGELGDPDT